MSIVENSKIKLTYDDYVGFPEDGQRHEIIDGDHCVTPSPSSYHQSILSRLHYQLFDQIENTGRGRVLPAPMDVLLSKVDIVQPDILVVLEPRTIDITPKNVQCAPDLIVEILSEATADRDRRLKKSLYEKSGVAEYWIVDPESRAVEQHVLKKATGRFEDRGSFRGELSAEALPDVRNDLRKVW
ncbi:MAG: Uma2 family endonuclease [Planctomycetota bacterium]|nr:Uma2 family endonuclease [Planctomycetota bacterium]